MMEFDLNSFNQTRTHIDGFVCDVREHIVQLMSMGEQFQATKLLCLPMKQQSLVRMLESRHIIAQDKDKICAIVCVAGRK